MNCPVCKRELAPTLSICLTCGAMMNDTVREELETKIGKIPSGPLKPTKIEFAETQAPTASVVQSKPIVAARPDPPQRPKAITAELTRRETSPTLVGFQPKNPTIPDWRIELQNSIRKRNGGVAATVEPAAPQIATQVATAAPSVAAEVQPKFKNDKVANALKRIEESRKAFSQLPVAAAAPAKTPSKPAVPNRSFPFNVVERTQAAPQPVAAPTTLAPSPKPQLVSSLRIEKKKFDTNKLPPIPEPELPLTGVEELDEHSPVISKSFQRMSIRNEADVEFVEDVFVDTLEEEDDLAPLSMRFGAAVFDLIIGGFASSILLSPFLISNAEVASLSGMLAIGGALLVVMFIYQTISMAYKGRTLGMRLFSIEIIDVETSELPTLHQSAVNSAVYLFSLLLAGIGFIPALINEERRTLHDILAGTVLVREY